MNCIALASFTHTRIAVLALSALGPEHGRFEEVSRDCRFATGAEGSQLPTPSVRVGNVSLESPTTRRKVLPEDYTFLAIELFVWWGPG